MLCYHTKMLVLQPKVLGFGFLFFISIKETAIKRKDKKLKSFDLLIKGKSE